MSSELISPLSVRSLLTTLNKRPTGHVYTAARIDGWNNVYLAVDGAGHPYLMVETEDFLGAPMLRAAKVSFKPSQVLTVTVDGITSTGRIFHTLVCESSDQSDVTYFLILIEAFIASRSGEAISGNDLATFFRHMVRLFAAKPTGDLESRRQGLWGELFVMRKVRGYRFWAHCWHGAVTGLFDFSAKRRHVEVKTALSDRRIHHFSHRQIWEEEGEQIIIASLLLRGDTDGLSLRELINDCRVALRGTPDYLKLEFAVRYAGMDDDSIVGPQFDANRAEQELLWFKAKDAPHFRVPEPSGVSETSYKVDLTKATPISTDELFRWLDDWTALPVTTVLSDGTCVPR